MVDTRDLSHCSSECILYHECSRVRWCETGLGKRNPVVQRKPGRESFQRSQKMIHCFIDTCQLDGKDSVTLSCWKTWNVPTLLNQIQIYEREHLVHVVVFEAVQNSPALALWKMVSSMFAQIPSTLSKFERFDCNFSSRSWHSCYCTERHLGG